MMSKRLDPWFISLAWSQDYEGEAAGDFEQDGHGIASDGMLRCWIRG